MASTPFASELLRLRGKERSRSAVAAAVGVSRMSLYDWETGVKAPSPEHLAALIRLYACDEATELRLWRLRSGAEGEQVAGVEVAA